MNKRLYVGGLSYSTTEEMLNELFSTVGTVRSADVIRDRQSGYSRGFGFVEMESEEGAEKAVSSLNGTMLDGREIRVAEAQPRRDRFRDRDRSPRW